MSDGAEASVPSGESELAAALTRTPVGLLVLATVGSIPAAALTVGVNDWSDLGSRLPWWTFGVAVVSFVLLWSLIAASHAKSRRLITWSVGWTAIVTGGVVLISVVLGVIVNPDDTGGSWSTVLSAAVLVMLVAGGIGLVRGRVRDSEDPRLDRTRLMARGLLFGPCDRTDEVLSRIHDLDAKVTALIGVDEPVHALDGGVVWRGPRWLGRVARLRGWIDPPSARIPADYTTRGEGVKRAEDQDDGSARSSGVAERLRSGHGVSRGARSILGYGDSVGSGIDVLTSSRAHALATIEQVTPWVNGTAARRLTIALDALAADHSGAFVDDADATWLSDALSQAEASGRVEHWAAELERLSGEQIGVVLSSSADYPSNLQLIHDRPPVLFVRGELHLEDRRSVAIVGTREASLEGLRLASRIAGDLAAAGIAIVSGLARGVDTTAHTAAVNDYRRTIAVLGTPIERVYPAANRGLASTIVERGGALVSQFLPGSTTGPWAFPVRNVTMSGLALGTIVVEAGETSGARLQAEAAVAHGKRLLLLDRLVTRQRWAEQMASLPNVSVVATADEVIAEVDQLIAGFSEPVLL